MMTATIPDYKRTPEDASARSRSMAAKSAKIGQNHAEVSE
jgi:hypothetical protein